MAIVVQTDDGSAVGANSYISVDYFRAYHTDRGNSLGAYAPSGSNGDIEKALVRATDFVDQRFRYKGYKCGGVTQPTEWPRYDCWDQDDFGVVGVPKAVKEATAEYALRTLLSQKPLNPDPTVSPTGAQVLSTTQSAEGVGSQSFTYAEGSSGTLPSYPAADTKLRRAGLVRGNLTRQAVRG